MIWTNKIYPYCWMLVQVRSQNFDWTDNHKLLGNMATFSSTFEMVPVYKIPRGFAAAQLCKEPVGYASRTLVMSFKNLKPFRVHNVEEKFKLFALSHLWLAFSVMGVVAKLLGMYPTVVVRSRHTSQIFEARDKSKSGKMYYAFFEGLDLEWWPGLG